jgi:hypothetical protein
VPQDILDLLDVRAGKTHSRGGPVVACLAEILTMDRARRPARISPERLAFLRAEVERHTRQCGPCDFGVVEYGCQCAGDPRSLLLDLLAELEAVAGVDSGHTPG